LGDRQQVNFQVPHERLLAQKSRLQVFTSDSSGSAQNSAPIDNLDYPKTGGFFAGVGSLAFARHAADGSWVTAQNPATTGETITILGTGFGATYPPKPVAFGAGQPCFLGQPGFLVPGTEYNLGQLLRVLNVGPRAAEVSSIGLAPDVWVSIRSCSMFRTAPVRAPWISPRAGSTVCAPRQSLPAVISPLTPAIRSSCQSADR
jgi:uncharacterized protein (TIGR03437 family)